MNSPGGGPSQRILLIRTFRPVGTGGPIPPLGLLYIASAIRAAGTGCDLKLIDVGNEELSVEDVVGETRRWRPRVVGLSVMTCEADLMHELAAAVKRVDKNISVIVGGPHANTAQESILKDPHIDGVVIREGEKTIVELLNALGDARALAGVRGIAYRDDNGQVHLTEPREPNRDLDALPHPAWDLIDIPSYARHKTWNGTLKRDFYAPIVTSRGCPYSCTFCHNIFGKTVRMRSAGGVFEEIRELHDRLGCREFHITDDIFNVDVARASALCRLIIAAGLDISLSFPNGLRADIMTDELLGLLKKAGTYKINYGFETATPRLQKLLKKEVDIGKAAAVFKKTSALGILTGAYFMLGIPTETREEMLATIRFAVDSPLDAAAFFKATAYPGTELHRSLDKEEPAHTSAHFDDLHFYSVGRSHAAVSAGELNAMILIAQRRFHFKPRRILRGLRKAPRKSAYLLGLLNAGFLVLQGYLVQEIKP